MFLGEQELPSRVLPRNLATGYTQSRHLSRRPLCNLDGPKTITDHEPVSQGLLEGSHGKEQKADPTHSAKHCPESRIRQITYNNTVRDSDTKLFLTDMEIHHNGTQDRIVDGFACSRALSSLRFLAFGIVTQR